jgi:hypothetical protein
MKTITVKQLKSLGACGEEIAIFKHEFGNYATINKKNLIRAIKVMLNVDWLLDQLNIDTRVIVNYNDTFMCDCLG